MHIAKKKLIISLTTISLLLLFFLIPSKSYAMEPVYRVLSNTTSGMGATVGEIWKNLLNMTNGFGIAVLIIVAFSQILRININTYGVKKILPAMILAIVAANFSFLFARLVIDLSNIISSYFIDGSLAINGLTESFRSGNTTSIDGLGAPSPEGNIFWFIIGQFLVIAGAILIYMVAYLFLIRNWVIYFLVAVAPLAMMATILPQTKSIFNQWWSNFVKWAFMPVVSLFWIWLGTKWFGNIGTSGIYLLVYVFAAVCFYMALTMPFKLGGSIMGTWGKIGKKVSSPALDLAKRKGSLAWSNQGASENKLNPFGHLARLQTGWQDAKKFDEEKIGNNRQAALAQIMKSRGGRKRTYEREKFGGDVDLAKEEVLRDYLQTKEGKEWARNRSKFMSRTNTAKAQKEAGLSKGMREFRGGITGKSLSEDLLRAQKDKELQEGLINIADKELVISFNKGAGPFANNLSVNPNATADQALINNYFAALARNKTLDEGVNQSSAQKVEAILADQMYLENMKNSLNRIPEELKRLDRDDERLLELSDLKRMGRISAGSKEDLELQALYASQVSRRNERTELAGLETDMSRKALEFAKGKGHLEGFVTPEGRIRGFAGTITGGDEKFQEAIGTTMMTRAGKLMSIEIKADADKLLDAKTPREIGEQLINGEAGKFSPKEVANFREGKQYLNTPEQNRRIEAHVIATSRTARQNTNPYRDLSRTALVSMLDDGAAISAGQLFNELAADRGMAERVDVSVSPDQIRTQIKAHMNNKQNKVATLAFASVEDQRNVGVSDNPANYLSGGGGYRSGSAESASRRIVDEPVLSPQQFSSLVSTVASAQGEYRHDLANNQEITKHLESITDALRAERNTIVNEIGKVAGINPNNELFKRTLNDAIMRIPRDQTDPSAIASALNPILKQFGGKEINTQTQVAFPGISGNRSVDITQATLRTQAANLAIQSSEMIRLQPQVQQIEPQINYFGNLSGGKDAVSNAMGILEKALNGPDGVRSPNIDAEQIKKIVNDTIRGIGMGTQIDINFSSNDEAIDFLKRTRDAANAANQAFDENGEFNPDRAKGIAAKNYLDQEKR